MPSFLSSISSFFSPAQSPSSLSQTPQSSPYPSSRPSKLSGFGLGASSSSSAGGRERVQRDTNEAFRLPRYLGEGKEGEGNGGGLGLGMPERGYMGRSSYRSESPTPSLLQRSASGYAYPPHAVHPPDADRYDVEQHRHQRTERRASQQPLHPDSSAILRSGTPTLGRSRPASQVGTNSFMSPNGPLGYYPPLNQTWQRIRAVLNKTVPEMVDTFNYPTEQKSLADLENALGCALPPSVRDSYLCVDGQDPSAECREGLFFGLTILPIEDVLREWTFWRAVETDPSSGGNPDVLAVQSSIPPGWIKQSYANAGWVPLIADKCGNYIGVDLDPGEDAGGPNGGAWGQVIVFGREFDRKCVLWRGEGEGGWGRWLAGFAEELERGEGWELDGGGSGSDGDDNGEDGIGYSSYYFDGAKGGGADVYGENGSGLRLTGEYRGWGVLEAFWDRSVRRWTELGLGLPEEKLEQDEAEMLRREENSGRRASTLQGLGFGGMRMEDNETGSRVAIPVLDDPNETITSLPPPPTLASLSDRDGQGLSNPDPVAGPSSMSSDSLHTSPSPLRLITPATPKLTMDPPPTPPPTSMDSAHPLVSSNGSDGFLSPPSSSPTVRQNKGKKPAHLLPTPAALDLPTRADVQAAHAVAIAESTGLRGGWVMSLEATRSGLNASRQSVFGRRASPRSSSDASADAGEAAEMVDIDLESGHRRPFGSSRSSVDKGSGDYKYAAASSATPQNQSPEEPSHPNGWVSQDADATPKAEPKEWIAPVEPAAVHGMTADTFLRKPLPSANGNAIDPSSVREISDGLETTSLD